MDVTNQSSNIGFQDQGGWEQLCKTKFCQKEKLRREKELFAVAKVGGFYALPICLAALSFFIYPYNVFGILVLACAVFTHWVDDVWNKRLGRKKEIQKNLEGYTLFEYNEGFIYTDSKALYNCYFGVRFFLGLLSIISGCVLGCLFLYWLGSVITPIGVAFFF